MQVALCHWGCWGGMSCGWRCVIGIAGGGGVLSVSGVVFTRPLDMMSYHIVSNEIMSVLSCYVL